MNTFAMQYKIKQVLKKQETPWWEINKINEIMQKSFNQSACILG